MIKWRLKQLVMSFVMLFSFIGGVAFLPSSVASAAACTDQSNILTFPNWYRGVYKNTTVAGAPECNIVFSRGLIDIWVVVSNIIEILIQGVGYVSVAFIIFGGFKYVTSQGESGPIGAAKQTITRAIIGLTISIVSVLILNLVVGVFGLRIDGNTYQIQAAPAGSTGTKP